MVATSTVGLSWGPIIKGHCIRYGVRQYSGILIDRKILDPGIALTQRCEHLGVKIYGNDVFPERCATNPSKNETWGYWAVNEPSCAPYWSLIEDIGCTAKGSGRRRFEAKLEGIENGADVSALCQSTPAEFNNRTFDAPDHCENRGEFGMFGIWDVRDNACWLNVRI